MEKPILPNDVSSPSNPYMATPDSRAEDDEPIELFSTRRPKDFRAGISSGLKSLGKGVAAGVAGKFNMRKLSLVVSRVAD
jgi:hypothetical protein